MSPPRSRKKKPPEPFLTPEASCLKIFVFCFFYENFYFLRFEDFFVADFFETGGFAAGTGAFAAGFGAVAGFGAGPGVFSFSFFSSGAVFTDSATGFSGTATVFTAGTGFFGSGFTNFGGGGNAPLRISIALL